MVSHCPWKKFLKVNNKENSMTLEIKTINLKFLGGLASVNCYLVKTDTTFILIDTGPSNKRIDIEKRLESAGCKPGSLKLVLITHGDSDHTGNAAYLCDKYGTKIAMHRDDSGMVEQGDMSFNRKPNIIVKILFSLLFFGLNKSDRFKPDIFVEDGQDLSNYGFHAKVIHIPGHSKGSIGILTADGDLFCGDLITNTNKPSLNSIMDDKVAANASFKKLQSLELKTVYPGHGEPFSLQLSSLL